MEHRGADGTRNFDLDERGFRGELRIEDRSDGRHVVLMGTRPDGSDTIVEKDVPANRDERLADLVDRCLAGDTAAAVEVLGHVGVLDPD